MVGGRNLLFVMTSMSGQPRRAWGRDLTSLGAAREVSLAAQDGGVWMEAILQDADGTWYGYYHNEIPATMCRTTAKVLPRIGAARSRDRGATWELLGVILEAPPRTYDCMTENAYFVGGVGDFSVQLDAESQDVYFFYSLYLAIAVRPGSGRRTPRVGRSGRPQRQDHDLAERRVAPGHAVRARRTTLDLSIGFSDFPGL